MRLLRRLFKPTIPLLAPGEAYDRWAESYASEVNPIKRFSDELVAALVPDLKGRSVLDIGCGTGAFCKQAWELGASHAVGLDISEGMLERARILTPQTEFYKTEEGSDYPVPEKSMDVAVTALVLGHISDIGQEVLKIHRVLKKKGTLIITDFHPTAALSGMKRTFAQGGRTYAVEHHVHTIENYKECLSGAGFRVEDVVERNWNGHPVVLAIKAAAE